MAKTGDITIIRGRYYNANYYATAIVAVVIEGINWAAYIGGAPVDIPEHEAMEFVAAKGCKLPEQDAHYFFPEITLPYRS